MMQLTCSIFTVSREGMSLTKAAQVTAGGGGWIPGQGSLRPLSAGSSDVLCRGS